MLNALIMKLSLTTEQTAFQMVKIWISEVSIHNFIVVWESLLYDQSGFI